MITADDLMELVEFVERGDGSVRATLATLETRLSLVAATTAGASRSMRTLCNDLAAQLNAARAADPLHTPARIHRKKTSKYTRK